MHIYKYGRTRAVQLREKRLYIVFPRFRGKGSSDLRKEEGADRGTTLVRCVSRKFERDDKGIGGRLFFAGGGGGGFDSSCVASGEKQRDTFFAILPR